MDKHKRLNIMDDQRLYGYIDRTLKVIVGRMEREEDMHPENMRKLGEVVDWLCVTVVQRENAKDLAGDWRGHD